MRSLWFCVPAHGRLAIAEVCFRQLRRTCDTLTENGTLATAVIVADDCNLELARANGFHTVERDNTQLGRRINDAYEVAGREGATWMVPLGSDDFIDARWILLPRRGQTIRTHLSTVVNDDCTRMAYLNIQYGDGVRVFERTTLEKVGFRPAEEHRNRAIDAATNKGVRGTGDEIVWHDTDPLCIVDWKSRENLNDYRGCVRHYGGREHTDVWERLAAVYPDGVAEMRALHDRGLVAA